MLIKIGLSCKEPNTDSMLYYGFPILKEGETIQSPFYFIASEYSLTAYLMNNDNHCFVGQVYNYKEHGQIFRFPPESERVSIMKGFRDKRIRKLIMIKYWFYRGCWKKYSRKDSIRMAKEDFKYT